jgi:hypothetical protein
VGGYGQANAQMIVDNYLGWTNQYPPYKISNFSGVPPQKLVMGVPVDFGGGRKVIFIS